MTSALEQHHISHGTQANHVRVLGQHFLLVTAEGGGQLEGNTHAGEGFVRISAAGLVGVHHGDSFRQNLFAFVVVGDDQIHAQFLAKLGFFHGGDAAVYGNDELYTLLCQCVEGQGVQAVAFLQPTGDLGQAVCAQTAEQVGEQASGGDAVHIVVAEYGDLLTTGHGKAHPAGGQVHIFH